MVRVHKAEDRGITKFGWLDSRHSFSFGDYYDPGRMGYRSLRVINDDRIAGGGGFDTHPHRDMEIITFILDGELEHRDSMGNGSVIRAGDVQVMSAGTGITHSEFNHDATTPVHLLQIWILPERRGLQPGYGQKPFPREERTGRLQPIATPDGRGGSLVIHQDASILAALLRGHTVRYKHAEGRHLWVQIASGSLALNGVELKEGDGAVASNESDVLLTGDGEALLFDLA